MRHLDMSCVPGRSPPLPPSTPLGLSFTHPFWVWGDELYAEELSISAAKIST